MRKFILAAAVSGAALALSACGQENIDEVAADTTSSDFAVTTENFYAENDASANAQAKWAQLDSLSEDERKAALRQMLNE